MILATGSINISNSLQVNKKHNNAAGSSPPHVIYVSTITLPCIAAQQCVDRQNNSCASFGTFALMRPLTNRVSARGRKSVGATAHCLFILSIGSSDKRQHCCRIERAANFENDEVGLIIELWLCCDLFPQACP